MHIYIYILVLIQYMNFSLIQHSQKMILNPTVCQAKLDFFKNNDPGKVRQTASKEKRKAFMACFSWLDLTPKIVENHMFGEFHFIHLIFGTQLHPLYQLYSFHCNSGFEKAREFLNGEMLGPTIILGCEPACGLNPLHIRWS